MDSTTTALKFRVDGVSYVFDQSDITPAIERQLLIEAGVTPQQALLALGQGAFFSICALVWLARKQHGDKIAYLAVESQLYEARRAQGEEFDLEILSSDETAPAPQLSGVSS